MSYKLKATLQTSQNKLSFLLGKLNRSHVGTAELKDIDWFHIEYRVAHMKLALMYRIVNGTAPEHAPPNNLSKLTPNCLSHIHTCVCVCVCACVRACARVHSCMYIL